MSAYQREQLEALTLVREGLTRFGPKAVSRLDRLCEPYLSFRREVAEFHSTYFQDVCTRTCYETRLSACCTKEGIITFFADVVVNALSSPPETLDRLTAVLKAPHLGHQCVYLGPGGCLWTVKPIVCEMFLCDGAQQTVFSVHPGAAESWDRFKALEKLYKWPDRPVLFDQLESVFMDADMVSSLMYLHHSPGLLRVKQKAGMPVKRPARAR